MICSLSEQELWSGLDRNAPEIAEHLEACPACRGRAAGIREGIAALSQASTPQSAPLPHKIGSYLIKGHLGEGGMGIVYEGEQQTPKRAVAVKVVRGGQHVDEYRLKLFQREVLTLARLKHPAIGAIYEAGRTADGQHYFAMELVRGERLNDYVRNHQVSRRDRLQLFRKICEAIHYAHLRGVIHRDLKPSNILVDAEGNPKILDFGLARITDPENAVSVTGTEIGKIMGTLPYMSPEEARGNPDEIDVRSDVYSLGVILFELLSDRLPFAVSKAVLHEAVRVICEEPPPRLGAADRSLRGDLETIVYKALEKERGRRYQSAAALSEDIQRYLASMPIQARRTNAFYQFRKFVQRNVMMIMFTMALAATVSVALLWISRAESELQAGVILQQELQDLEIAANKSGLAASYAESGDYVRAQKFYLEALMTLTRLQRYEHRAAGTMLELGLMLLRQQDPDYHEAEQWISRALLYYDRHPGASIEERRKALTALQQIYSIEALDFPEDFLIVEEALRRLDDPPPAPGL